MRIHEQNQRLKSQLISIADDITTLEMALERKTSMPYPDGSTNNLVNIATDVLPLLNQVRQEVGIVIGEVTGTGLATPRPYKTPPFS
jgi:hypothetical protein